MDVVALSQYGVSYAVATLGTATTPWQIQKLFRQTDNVIYCFDGDAAGRRAAWRALENTLSQLQDGKRVRFLFLPAEHDPDSFVRANGKETFETLLEAAPSLSEILVRELISRVDMRTIEGRAKLLEEAKPLVKQIVAPMLSLMLRRQFAELAGISEAELDRNFEIKSVSRFHKPERRDSIKPSLVRALAEMLAFRPSLAALANAEQLNQNADLASSELPQSDLNMLGKLLDACTNEANLRSIAEHFRGSELERLAHEIEAGSMKWQDLDDDALQAEFVGAWAKLADRFRNMRMTALLEKSKSQSWTSEEKEQFRRLQQGANETLG
jgi:DNA primase